MRFLVFIVVLVCPFQGGNLIWAKDDGNKDLIKAIKTAWSRRQTRLSSVEYVFNTRRYEKNRWKNLQTPSKKPASNKVDYIEYNNTRRMLFSGCDRIRYEFKGEILGDKGELERREAVYTSNGKVSKLLNTSKVLVPYPTGEIYKDEVNRCAYLADTLPLRWTFVPVNSEYLGFDVDNLKIEGKGIIDGQICLIFKNDKSSEYYWIDPSRDYSILRYTVEYAGKVEFQLESLYKPDSSEIWIPFKWIVTHFNQDSTVRASADNELQSYKIGANVDDDDFDIKFLPGTIVSDARSQTGNGPSDILLYLVLPDGSKRIITWDERFATYEEIKATPSGKASGKTVMQPQKSKTWFLVGSLLLLCVLVILLGIRLWKKTRKTS